jgi:hypothetical protein
MKKIGFILFIVLTINLQAQTPTWLWAKDAGGTNSEEGTAIAVDAIGNTYITGFFASLTCPFGTTSLTNVGFNDIFIAKYDPASNLVWVKSAGGSGDDKPTGIAVDTSGNVYITGYFSSSTITFDTITFASNAGTDLFIAKYNSVGNVVWAKKAGGATGDFSNSIVVDASGNSLITGYFKSASISFGSTTLLNPYSTSGGSNYFIAKYNALGNPIWAKAANGGAVIGNNIKTNNIGEIFVIGSFLGNVAFDTISKTSNGSKDVFVTKYDTTGNAIWVKTFGGSNEDVGNAISTDLAGNSYITGYSKSISMAVGSTTLSNNGSPNGDVFIVKFDATGNIIWAKKAVGYSNDVGLAIAADATGNSYLSGYYNGSPITFGTITLNSAFSTTTTGDLFVVKYNTAGTALWAKNLVASTGAKGNGIALDAANNCYLTGFYEDVTLQFDNITLTNAGNQGIRDIFVGKIGNTSTVGLSENNKLNDVTVFPNPTTGRITIALNSASKVDIEILNIVGEIIYKATAKQMLTVDLTAQAKGIYFVKVTEGNRIVTNRKIIID